MLHRNWLPILLLAFALFGMAVVASPVVRAATFIVVNNDGPGEGFNDPTVVAPVGGNTGTTVGAQRLIAFQHAADIWGGLLSSAVTIRVGAKFDPLSCTATSAILGSAGPANGFRDFSGALLINTYYPVALANALHGSDLDLPNLPTSTGDDINAQFNSAIGTPGCLTSSGWYYGLDSNPPSGKIDFVTILLHELGHGLGFLTFVNLTTGAKPNGFNDTFMRNLEDHGATPPDYPSMTNAQRVTASTHTGNLHWTGANVRAASGVLTAGMVGDHVRMYAPNPQQSGSSVSHWDTALTPNQVMEPSYTGPLHNPVLELPLFQDIGWTLLSSPVISVTPNSQDFGTVTVGSFADRDFTVQNTGGGTLAGTASTSAPFSIISGASYSLGAGASQTVTVRFSPTSATTFAGNVTFTGGGGATRPVIGTTPSAQFIPVTGVANPTAGGTVNCTSPVTSGSTTTCAITTNAGFTLTGATSNTCGGSLSGSTYTTGAVTSACTVTATFSQTPTSFPVTGVANPIAGGTVNCTSPVTSGSTTTCAITTNAGFTLTGASSNTCGGSLSGSTYTTGAVTSTCTVTANFTQFPIVDAPVRFIPVTPCRAVDTRSPGVYPISGGRMASGDSRSFALPSSACGIPSNALAYSLNATVVPNGPLGFLTMWPTGQTQPLVSTLNSPDGRTKANAAIVRAGTGGAVSTFVTNSTDLILDIDGYFVAAGSGGDLAFYPLSPCRLSDTRFPPGTNGGPTMGAGETRTLSTWNRCGIPSGAPALSLNYTVVPQGPLGFLTTWPAGQAQPLVSTLNAPTGTVVANAAIVPTGTGGQINVVVTNTTDVIIDVNGYFAPAGSPGALSFFAATPCRVSDTRNPAGPFGGPQMVGGSTRSYAVPGSACGIPSSAQAYSLNATVVPSGLLGYLTLWPTGISQPLVSTLNAWDGAVTSNAALAPAGTAGGINAFVTNSTDLILDINGYFAP